MLAAGPVREAYRNALRATDQRNLQDLIDFSRS
jgi:hypothetical protein